MTEQDYRKFAKTTLGVTFNDIGYLMTALTHRSWLNEHRRLKGLEHNERLEFLGDAVLELDTTEYLYTHYKEPEGILTNWRSALVRTESIGAAAERLDLWPYIRLSRGEKQGSERAKLQILANAFEALLGAIYLDQGYEPAKRLIEKNILSTLEEILRLGSWQDPKSQLQELAQASVNSTPNYRVLDEEGPDHDKIFTVGVYLGNTLYGKGMGSSKQLAQQAAAHEALARQDEWSNNGK